MDATGRPVQPEDAVVGRAQITPKRASGPLWARSPVTAVTLQTVVIIFGLGLPFMLRFLVLLSQGKLPTDDLIDFLPSASSLVRR